MKTLPNQVGSRLATIVLATSVSLADCAESPPPQPVGPLPEIGSPPANAKNVPPDEFAAHGISVPAPHISDRTRINHRGEKVTWTAKVCIDVDGKVSYVHALASFTGADPDISNVVRSWRFAAQPQPICTLVRLVYTIGG